MHYFYEFYEMHRYFIVQKKIVLEREKDYILDKYFLKDTYEKKLTLRQRRDF